MSSKDNRTVAADEVDPDAPTIVATRPPAADASGPDAPTVVATQAPAAEEVDRDAPTVVATQAPAAENVDRDTPTVVATEQPAAGAVGPDAPTVVATQPPAPDEIAPGTLLVNTYRVERLLGGGGMGEVYLARHTGLGTEHAIKVIRSNLASNGKVMDLFYREARVLRGVRHDAVVNYDGFVRDDQGRDYLVMEFAEGPSLADRLASGALTSSEVVVLRDRLAAGLADAHRKGAVHRDISPDNVILPGGRIEDAKLIDFGICKLTDPAQTTIIGSNFAGKYRYASPEQLGLGGGGIDARSDIYSLGLVLAEAALGRPLNSGTALDEVMRSRLSVPSLDDVPAQLRGWLSAMLQPDPAQRPASLDALLERWPGQAQPGGGKKTSKLPWAIAAIVAAGGAAGLYWLLPPLLQQQRPPDRISPASPPETEQQAADTDRGEATPATPEPPPGDAAEAQVAATPPTEEPPPTAAAETRVEATTPAEEPPPIAAAGTRVEEVPQLAEADTQVEATTPAEKSPPAADTDTQVEATPPADEPPPIIAPETQVEATPPTDEAPAIAEAETRVETTAKTEEPPPLAETEAQDAASQPATAKAEPVRIVPGTRFSDSLAAGGSGPVMVWLPAGEFQMGSPADEAGRNSDELLHLARVDAPIAFSENEITIGDLRQFVEATGYRTEVERQSTCLRPNDDYQLVADLSLSWESPGYPVGNNHPVSCISWNDARKYAEWLAQTTGHPYRLPTEQEWEYAARAGTGTSRFWGDDPGSGCNLANTGDCDDGHEFAAPAGAFPANPFGLRDVLGNVAEWTCSGYSKAYSGPESRCSDPREKSARIFRGGSWLDSSTLVRSAARDGGPSDLGYSTVGLRVVRTAPPAYTAEREPARERAALAEASVKRDPNSNDPARSRRQADTD